jgi:hypothetical protein
MRNEVPYPPFKEFVSLIEELSISLNDPGFVFDSGHHNRYSMNPANVHASKTQKIIETLSQETLMQMEDLNFISCIHSLNLTI